MESSSIVSPLTASPANWALRYSVRQNLFKKTNQGSPAVALQIGTWITLPEAVKNKNLLQATSGQNGQKTYRFQAQRDQQKVLGLWTTNENVPETNQQRRFKLFLIEGEAALNQATTWSKQFAELATELIKLAPFAHQSGENLRQFIFQLTAGFRTGRQDLQIPKRIALVDVIAKSQFSQVLEGEKDQDIHISHFSIGTNLLEGTGLPVLSEMSLTSVRMQQQFVERDEDGSTSVFKISEDFPQIKATNQVSNYGELKLHERHITRPEDLEKLKNQDKQTLAIGLSKPISPINATFWYLHDSKQAGFAIPARDLPNIFNGIDLLDSNLRDALFELYRTMKIISPESIPEEGRKLL